MTTPSASFLAARTRSAQGFGQPVPRKEDARLVTGRGPHAHARILSIEASAALAVPGVLAVLTGRDAAADGLARARPTRISSGPRSPRAWERHDDFWVKVFVGLFVWGTGAACAYGGWYSVKNLVLGRKR